MIQLLGLDDEDQRLLSMMVLDPFLGMEEASRHFFRMVDVAIFLVAFWIFFFLVVNNVFDREL